MQDSSGKVHHAEISIGDSRLMLADEHPEVSALCPETVAGSPVSIHLYVEDVDAVIAAAVAAGAPGSRARWTISSMAIALAASPTPSVIVGTSPRIRRISPLTRFAVAPPRRAIEQSWRPMSQALPAYRRSRDPAAGERDLL